MIFLLFPYRLLTLVYTASTDNPTKGDFAQLVKADLENIVVIYDEDYFNYQTKEQFKHHMGRHPMTIKSPYPCHNFKLLRTAVQEWVMIEVF